MTLPIVRDSFVTFIHEVEGIVRLLRFHGGFVVKSFVFAILIAGIGCLRGLQTSAGARPSAIPQRGRVRFGHHPARYR